MRAPPDGADAQLSAGQPDVAGKGGMVKKAAGAGADARRAAWAAAGLEGPFARPLKPCDEALVAPILVNCSGSSSDESEASSLEHALSGRGSSPGVEQRTSIASTLDGADGGAALGEPVAPTRIAAADVQRGLLKTGVRYTLETWPDSALLRALDAFLAMSSMFGYTATLLLIVLLGGLAWSTRCWPLGAFIAFVVLSVLLPAEPLLWEGFQNSTLVSSWRRYFNFSFALDAKLDPRGRYIFAAFPHGVFPVSELLCISLMLRIWPALRVYSICASSVFNVPVWRHILCWTGARPATAAHFRALLQRGSVSLVPGGIAEMFLWEQDREVIKVRERKGFVRIAVETGTPLVPVYHFGNSKLFSWVAPRCLEGLSRRLRTAVGYPSGRWGTLMPANTPLFMAVGSPIPVPHIRPGEAGYDAAVDAAHAALVAALEGLYHKYKGLYGWEDRELVVT